MRLTGEMLIGQKRVKGSGPAIQAIDPKHNQPLDTLWHASSAEDLDRACALAQAAADDFRDTAPADRATFLEVIADEIEGLGNQLVTRATAESGLPEARIRGECDRTCGQLRMFARVVRKGEWLDVRVDPALPEREPMPRADLRQRKIALGPVAVFGASNFPLAFSVAGGDTASALAAGCPVIVKVHNAHPGTSELVGRAIQTAVDHCNLPEGVFSLLYDSDTAIGHALVMDPRIAAVGFTGSRRGGLALWQAAQSRPVPIPVYAEMSSINPVFALPSAVETRGADLGETFVASLSMGAGQFCTNPGLVIALEGPGLDAFIGAAQAAIGRSDAQTMLTPGISDAYRQSVSALANHERVTEIARGQTGIGPNDCQSGLFTTTAGDFLADETLQNEIFGASSLIVACADIDEMHRVARRLEGQLTVTLQLEDRDIPLAQSLMPILEDKAGRILANGWPTGVEVCDAMVHGGPFPATTDARTTSVGTAAIVRFLRPVCYQNLPNELLPRALRHDNPEAHPRLVDGQYQA
ncbi:aldehyde dehydrogenase (NADP(+)) [Salinisphaera sp. LB1]|uniref:aldehyde dehydrogenase (NADP(+)) n=1 Tax=Salinisphaera sp. LB1 TaxID=2183911 RepID=UPI000D7054C5|nr:Ketoglutarate semialdehyde dehydrogenase [Salinisphaera sp. LB1]